MPMSDLVERLRHYIGWRSDAFRSECDDLTWPKPVDIKLAEEAASRISQQDAELERLRREVEEAREQARFAKASDQAGDEYIENMRGAIAALKVELAEARKAAFIEAAEIADGHAAEMRPKLAKYLKKGDEHGVAVYESAISEAVSIAAAIRAKVEEART